MTHTPDTLHANTRLAERILDAFPSGSYALTALLRLLDIVETDEVPTAAVECRAQPRLLINPGFVARHADTPETLLMLVMHELHHVLLGHTTLFPRVTPVENFVFDAVINGLVCRMFADTAHTAFFTGFYRDDRFPECLLRPPAGWPARSAGPAPGLTALPEPLRLRALEVHAALYSAGGASYHEVYSLLPEILQQAGALGDLGVPLLGDHGAGDAAHSQLQTHAPLIFEIVRDLVEQWPQPPDPIRGRSLADVLRTTSVTPVRQPSHRAVLRGLIRKVAGLHGQGRVFRRGADAIAIQGPLPTPHRRGFVLQALGVQPLLHDAAVPWVRRQRSGQRVHVYLDVSGSMATVLQALYGAVLDCEDWVHPQVHLFSTKVNDIPLTDLRRGVCPSTGGTDMGCVAEHMATHHVTRALIVTDGWVGAPRGAHLKTLAAARLAVAYLGAHINQNDLAAVADHTAILQPTKDTP